MNDIWSFDLKAMKWKFLANGYYGGSSAGFFQSPVVANGLVYAGNSDSYFYAIDASTGGLRWQFGGNAIVVVNGTVKQDMVYVGSTNNNIYALNALTGNIKWQYATGGQILGASCVVTDDHIVYHPGSSGEHQ